MVSEFEDDSYSHRALVGVGNVKSVSRGGVVAYGARAVVSYSLGRYFGELITVVLGEVFKLPEALT